MAIRQLKIDGIKCSQLEINEILFPSQRIMFFRGCAVNFNSPVRIDGFRESLGLQVLVVSGNTRLRKQTLAVVVAIKSTGRTLRNITEIVFLYYIFLFWAVFTNHTKYWTNLLVCLSESEHLLRGGLVHWCGTRKPRGKLGHLQKQQNKSINIILF